MSDAGSSAEAVQPQGDNGLDPNPDLHKIARWIAEIELYERETSKWRKQSKRIIKRYKDDRGDQDTVLFGARFNAFWANIQTQMPSLYARNPKPDIQRRFKDADPVGRVTSDILERCSSYFADNDNFYDVNRQAVKDYKIVGRGTTWIRYVPHLVKQAAEVTDDTQEGEELSAPEVIAYEEVLTDYVHPDDFGHNICRTTQEIWCGWRIVYMDRTKLVQRFGKEKGNVVPLDYVQKDLSGEKLSDGVGKASIYELWDKDRKCTVWFHKSMPEALDLRPDPLNLDGFFPFPMPLLTNLANDSCIPTPDYIESQDQYLELDDLTTRIASLTKAVKAAGVYDASCEGLGRLLNEGVENKLIPVENFAVLADKGGLDGAISWMPLKDITEALLALYQARDKVKEDLHEISGIPDIARGQSDAGETLGAQEIKTSFAINRISDDQRDVQRFVREEIRLIVDVICGHFQIETIKKISGVRLFTAQEKAEIKQFQQAMQMAQQAQQQPPQPGMPPHQQMPPPAPPQALSGLTQDQIETMMTDPTWEEVEGLMRDDAMRCFRIDIETDSTIKADEEQEKASRIEYIKTIGEYMTNALPAGQQHPELVPYLLEGLQFLARAFSVGKTMESALNLAIQQLEKTAKNPQPKPDPEMMKVQGGLQLQQSKIQGDMQLEQMKEHNAVQLQQSQIQADAQAEASKAQAQAAVQQHLNQLEDQRRQNELQGEQQLEQYKADLNMQVEQAKIASAERMAQIENDREILKARIQQETAIEVARISASVSDGKQEEARAQVQDDQLSGGVPDRELHSKIDSLANTVQQAVQNQGQNDSFAKLHEALTAEKEVVRDPKTGKATGIRVKQSKPDNASIGKKLQEKS